MKALIIFCSLLLSGTLIAQEKSLDRKWKIGVSFSPNKQLGPGRNYHELGCVYDYILPPSYYSRSSFGFSVGIVGQYAIKPRLEVGTGVNFQRRNAPNFHTGCYYALVEPGYAPGLVYLPIEHYIQVPLFLRYTIIKSDLSLHTEGGILAAYALRMHQYNRTPYQLHGRLGLGINYDIGNRLNIGFTTFFNAKITDFKKYTNYTDAKTLSFELRTLFKI